MVVGGSQLEKDLPPNLTTLSFRKFTPYCDHDDENYLCPVPIYEGVAIIAAEQLGHRDHRHVLLQTKVGVDQPSQLTS